MATIAPRAIWDQGRRRTRLALASLYLWCVYTMLRSQPFAWVLRGVYIGLPPGGTMVIRLGAGPSRQCLRSPASPPAVGSRRLPASWSTGRPHRLGSCRRLLTVASPVMTRALSRQAWLQWAASGAITVASPRLVSLMGLLLRGGESPASGGRLCSWPTRKSRAAFTPPSG